MIWLSVLRTRGFAAIFLFNMLLLLAWKCVIYIAILAWKQVIELSSDFGLEKKP